ncbi:AAA family ATPase [Planctomycetota bacterium]|nr:AAA family ATPase [Planctomycetota bacterium]
MDKESAIAALYEALALTPENLPLRQYLAQSLMQLARYEDAVEVFKVGLKLSIAEISLEQGLASAFSQLGRNSEALAILETLGTRPNCPPQVHFDYAKLLLGENDIRAARTAYQRAITAAPELADAELGQRLGAAPSVWNDTESEAEDESQPATSDFEKPEYGFENVGGMLDVKEQIRRKIIQPMQNPEIYEAYGKKIGGGILLYGPPGCGKTHIARATAGEVDANFISVGINDVLNMWIGESEKSLHELFEQARDKAPCVLFFDEVDALGASRNDMKKSAGRQLINQFLSELDGVNVNNDGLLILAATNTPWHLDSAFRRPGRFDRIVFVPPPDTPARAEILRIHLKGKPVDVIDFDALAKKSKQFSGADLKACIDEAIDEKLEESLAKGALQPVTTKELQKAIKRHKPTTKEWFSTARNYALYSNQGGHYDDILEYLKTK